MIQFLTFQLYGAMASWGEIAVGEERDTAFVPTRSAVIGLCAAALGIRREDEDAVQQLDAQLGVATCGHAPGSVLRDYHTIQMPQGKTGRNLGSRRAELQFPTIATSLSKRHYLVDAYVVVAVWAVDASADLQRLEAAMKAPIFTPYLGRKCCPLSLPLAPEVREASTLKEAFEGYRVDRRVCKALRIHKHTTRVVSSDAGAPVPLGFDLVQTTSRWDRVVSRRRWQFAPRPQDEGRPTISVEVR